MTKQNRFSAIQRSLVLAAITAFAFFLALPGVAHASGTGNLTVNASNGSSTEFVAYQIFAADVVDGDNGLKTASNIEWASDAARSAVNGVIGAAPEGSAQDAADWLRNNVQSGSSASAQGSVPNAIASSLLRQADNGETLEAGTPKSLSEGYWIVVSKDASVGQDQSGTSAILVMVGGSDVTVTAKSGVPTVEKQVLEDSGDAWQKQADATVGDDLWWRLDATVPSILSSYTSYKIVFDDTLSAGLSEPSDIHVYISSAAADVWETGTEASSDWTELDSAEYATTYEATADGGNFKVALDLVEAAKAHAIDAFAGVQVVVVYNAPLTDSAGTGMENGNVNGVTLTYPKSTYSTETTTTQESTSVAYTWNLSLTKRDSSTDKALAGAVLRIQDDKGRYLTQDGTWSEDEAMVTTGDDGTILVKGVDAGTFTVEEVSAPEGYVAFSGKRKVVLAVPYAADQIVSSPSTEATLTAESPLEATGFVIKAGTASVSILNSTTPGGGETGGSNLPTPASILHALGLPDTSDTNSTGLVLGLAALGAVILIVAIVLRRRGGSKR